MKLLHCFLVLLCIITGTLSADDIVSMWSVNHVEYRIIHDDKQEVLFSLSYEIANNTDKPVWFYDMERGNDLQYVEMTQGENIIEKRVFIFKPYEKSNGGWYGSWGYSPVFPEAFRIDSHHVITGEMRIGFVIDDRIHAEEMIYQFNFIILDLDIGECFSRLSISEVNEKHSKNYYVQLAVTTN